jgi:hypothetical protein
LTIRRLVFWDTAIFLQSLVRARFNPGKTLLGSSNFVADTAASINAAAGRMQCC